jgi:hypothetical protein
MLGRISTGVASFSTELCVAVMRRNSDAAALTDRGLRDAVFQNATATMSALRINRRQRQAALEEILDVTFEGYRMARYLLGTFEIHPRYSNLDHPATLNAKRLNDRCHAYAFDDLILSLDGDEDVIGAIGDRRVVSPLLSILGDEQGTTVFLAAYTTGVALALAEEELFGPALGTGVP